MGYICLALSLIAGSTKGYCAKMTSGYVNGYRDSMLANIVRMVICIFVGFSMTVIQSGIGALKVDMPTLWIAFLSGVATAIFLVSWLMAIKNGAYMMMNVFLMLGTIVPLMGSSIIFGENVSIRQCVGLAVLFVAVYIMCSYNSGLKGKMSISAIVVLITCGMSSGFMDFSQKLFVERENGILVATFNFYSYIFSAVILCILYALFSIKSEKNNQTLTLKNIFGYILVMSICLFANSFFLTKAAEYLPSAQLYPLSKGTGLILSALMSAVLFNERLNIKAVVGIIMSFVALLVINL